MSASACYNVDVKVEPRNFGVCFVCGSSGAEYALQSKHRSDGPFFPFLDHHVPPEGSERPGPDGMVAACIVCYSFLVQQWDTYEVNRTPHNKRLYWLKRTDHRPFAGMESGMQTEYASEFLGIPQNSEELESQCYDKSQDSIHQESKYYRDGRSDSTYASNVGTASDDKSESDYSGSGGVLDLSVPNHSSSQSSSSLFSPSSLVDVCYVCGEEGQRGTLVNVYAKSFGNCPFFPSLLLHPKPNRAKAIDVSGKTKVCETCQRHLLQQWDTYQSQNVPHTERFYQLRVGQNSIQSSSSSSSQDGTFICFTCGQEYSLAAQRVVSVRPGSDVESYFPFLEKLVPPVGANPLSSFGKALICSVCYKSLMRQLKVYELSGTPEERRTYKLMNEVSSFSSTNLLKQHLSSDQSTKMSNYWGCYICGKLPGSEKMNVLDTIAQKGGMFFTFLHNYIRPPNAKPLDHNGQVLTCFHCYSSLKAQWKAFESAHIPEPQRQYTVSLGRSVKIDHNITASHSLDSTSKNTHSALHVNVSLTDTELNTNRQIKQDTLLTPVSNISFTSSVSTSPNSSHNSPRLETLVTIPSSKSHYVKSNTDDMCNTRLCISGPLDYTSPVQPLLLATTCYICGEYSSPGHTFPVWAIPQSPQNPGDSCPSPFFPFLPTHVPPQGAEPLSEDKRALVCAFCYYSLIAQWMAYETSPHPEDANGWQRKYNSHNYICYICGITTYRKRVRSITVHDFPFLAEHPRPLGALTLHGGESVVTCLTCFESLTSQWKDFERMKLPVEMRKYNWITLPPPPEEDLSKNIQTMHSSRESTPLPNTLSRASSAGSEGRTSLPSSSLPDNQQEVSSSHHTFSISGLPHGCKPPPLTMHPPCGTSQKPVGRTMATVSPLHQVPAQPSSVLSPYGGNNMSFNSARTSSFAAALRKLAKQAVEPVTAEKDLSPITPVSSPALAQQSAASKRSVPTMYLSSHQVAYSSGSPPVVTIAPTRSHVSHTSDHRKLQAMDLSNLPQSGSNPGNNSHIVEPLSLKLEGTKPSPRSLHGEKWENHALNSKELGMSSGVSQVRPHATIAPLPRLEDALTPSRGFQPYRGVEDVRPSVKPQISPYDHPSAPYHFHPAFLPPPRLPHLAYRLDDPLYLERYSLLHSPLVHFPGQPGMLPPPTAALYPSGRYPPELLTQTLSVASPSNTVFNHERLKQEEERRHHEKILQEREHMRSREQEHERLQEKDRERIEKIEHQEQKQGRNSPVTFVSSSDHGARQISIIQSTPHDTTPKRISPPVSSASGPLNLVVHPNNIHQKHPQREAELWLPWQQQPTSQHESKANQREPLGYRHPLMQQPEVPHLTLQKSQERIHSMSLQTVDNPQSGGDGRIVPGLHGMHTASAKFNGAPKQMSESVFTDKLSTPWDIEKQKGVIVTSQEKKGMEDIRKGSSESQQLRPAVNGLLVMSSQQNEGIYARLLETEKCRIEYRGGNIVTEAQPNHQTEQDRLPLSVPKLVHSQFSSKESSLSGMPMDHHQQYVPTLIRNSVEIPKVVSKLDLEAERMQREKTNEEDSESEEENDENRLFNALVITKGPPLKLDLSPKKLEFLRILGLTTQYKKQEVELEKYLKSRRILQERSITPPIEEEPEEKVSLSDIVSNLRHLSEKLCLESSPEKHEFAQGLGLQPVSLAKREDKDGVWRVVMDERDHRKSNSLAIKQTSFRAIESKDIDSKSCRAVKRKTNSHPPNGLILDDVDCGEPPIKMANTTDCPGQTKVPALSSVHKLYKSTSSEKGLPVSAIPSRGLKLLPQLISKTLIRDSEQSIPSDNLESVQEEGKQQKPCPSIILPQNHKQVSKSFVQEFHESVLQTTQVQQEQNRSQGLSETTASQNTSHCPPVQCCPPVAPKVEDSSSRQSIEINLHADREQPLRWPGIEAIIEAYHRHQAEQKLEREVLLDRCHFLRVHNQELKNEADHLSQCMSELLQLKHQLSSERSQHQRAIDNLKKCLRQFR